MEKISFWASIFIPAFAGICIGGEGSSIRMNNIHEEIILSPSYRIEYNVEINENYYQELNRSQEVFKHDLTYTSALTMGFGENLSFPDIEISMNLGTRQSEYSGYGEKISDGCLLLGGIGIGMVGVLMILPRSITNWEGDYIEKAFRNMNRAYTKPPVWDKDDWDLNYIGHPYAGSVYYNYIRSQNGTRVQSFLFSILISTGWEYVYEGFAEQPSIQDLILTPVIGSFIGELSHHATIGMKRNGFNIFEKMITLIINPTYVFNNGF